MAPLEFKRRKLRGSGRKATPQRLSILEAIDGIQSCFTPQQLYERLQKQHLSIGLVTVYRTLALLAACGLVCRMERSGRSQSYAHCPERHHHHLVCTGCNRVVDIVNCGLDELEYRLTRETGFAISEHLLEFSGLCRECQKSIKGATL
jgi:Fur family ferric uptake transcriptional regulator